MADVISAEFNFMKAIVIRAHSATDDSQLELHLHEVVNVLEKDTSGWWGGHKEGEDNTGWFPGTCVRAVSPEQLAELAPLNTTEDGPVANDGGDVSVELRMCGGPASQEQPEQKELQEQPGSPEPMHRQHRLVASPQRMSGAAMTGGAETGVENVRAQSFATLQAEYTTTAAINEDLARENQRLQSELQEVTLARRGAELDAEALRKEKQELQEKKRTNLKTKRARGKKDFKASQEKEKKKGRAGFEGKSRGFLNSM